MGVSGSQEKYTEFSVTYLDGEAISPKDKLGAGKSLPIKVKVRYKDDITASDLPSSDQTLSLSMSLTYVQADSSAKEVNIVLPFSEHSWTEIFSNVKAGYGHYYQLGDTREINMESFGTHTLRVANTSTPEEYATKGFSQTACGFVLEFADIITNYAMNLSYTNVGGCPATKMCSYVNGDIYDALPSELKEGIVETTVVSGHGSDDSQNFISTDKLYLLSTKEVWGKEGTSNQVYYDTAESETRQLDYYKSIGTTTTNFGGVKKQYQGSNWYWWLRTARSNMYDVFYNATRDGDWGGFDTGDSTVGVSLAFRLG